MSADKLADMLCTSIKDVNEMSGMSADKLTSGRKTSPTCRVGVHCHCVNTQPNKSGSDKL
jgi:hypothetical protein